MHRLKCPIIALVMLLALTLPVWSQTQRYTVPAASLRDDFSAYHHALDKAADSALANIAIESVVSSQTDGTAGSTTTSPDTEVLRRFATKYWNGNDEAVQRTVARLTQLRPILTRILREEGVPDEVAAIVLIESAGQATALSPKGARGIWQFMPDTARRYGLAVTADRDERIEVVKSTHAAARYLRDLYRRLGDWRLTFAAYNAGEQAVEQAVIKTGHGDFSRIERALPEETRSYVPAVMHAMELLGSNQRGVLRVVKSKASPAWSVLYASTAGAD
jgi:membrane-bound lytic murein transglycosylase B